MALVEPVALPMGRNLIRQLGPEGFAQLATQLRFSGFVAKSLGLEPLPEEIERFQTDICDPDLEADPPANRKARLLAIKRGVERVCGERIEPVFAGSSFIERNLRRIGQELGLDTTERNIIGVLVTSALHGSFRMLLWNHQPSRVAEVADLVAVALGTRASDVRARLRPDSPLRLTGLIARCDPQDPADGTLMIDSRLAEMATDERLTRGAVLKRFVTTEPAATLEGGDFRHMAVELDVVERLLRQALATKAVGVNVLLHGPSGVGKTEAARLLAARAGGKLYLAGAADSSGESPSGRERLASHGVAQRLLPESASLVLFDELEDVAGGRQLPFGIPGFEQQARPSKLWFNRLLEENRVPTIWTTNELGGVDPALLRRFSIIVAFRPLGPGPRRAAWERHAGKELAGAELDALAQAHDVSPGEIGGAVTAARLAGCGTVDRVALDRILAGVVDAQPGRKRAVVRRAGADYRPEAVHASTDLVALADRLAGWKPTGGVGLSLCLYGRSGTGKSEFVHHVAKRMGRPVVVRRPSDLESKWLGETEKNIAAAFAEASAEEAVLLFDEVDSLVRDRRHAERSWEVSQVNEFLQQLEACRGFVACTTNLFRELDQAVLRRFTFKVEFLAPLAEQVLALFDAHLASRLAEPADRGLLAAALRRAGALVPGDFAVVARKVEVMGGKWTLAALVEELAAEVRARGEEGRAVGF
jgi:SpoVK/Ycf46/Vps4 family AAA+-type ATPase